MNHVAVIAEAGVNHNGSVSTAKLLIEAAATAGADIVKFQTFQADLLVTKWAKRASYQARNIGGSETQWKMLKRLELNQKAHHELNKFSKDNNIEFLSTPFDEKSAQFLNSEIGVRRFKVPSGEITNLPFLDFIANFKKPVILSTGMSTLAEVREAVAVLTRTLPKKLITLLHCTTSYPCKPKDVNLKAMQTLRSHFKVQVGYSDHTLGTEVSIAAVALGAQVIEKHLTLNRRDKGPDHAASIEPHEFKQLVKQIRNVEQSLGSGQKKPTTGEIKIRKITRKSVYATHRIPKGSILKLGDLVIKRPGLGISPVDLDYLIGKKIKKHLKPDECLKWTDLEL